MGSRNQDKMIKNFGEKTTAAGYRVTLLLEL